MACLYCFPSGPGIQCSCLGCCDCPGEVLGCECDAAPDHDHDDDDQVVA